jgi:hypothetical protein
MADPTMEQVMQAIQAAAQAAQQAAQAATNAAQTANQTAQQVAQQVADAVSQAVQKMMQTTGGVTEQGLGARTAASVTAERVEDIGGGEAHESGLNAFTHAMNANIKRTYDEYQQESLESIKRNRSYVDKVLSDAATHDNRVRQIAEQALQNAVETSNMVGKQAVRHSDIAIDREWNIDEVSDLAAKSGVQADTIQGIVATVTAAVLAELGKQKATS